MKTVKDFVGNHSSVEKLCNWLTKYYHEPTAEISNYCILSGLSGNGKSFLPFLLANSFGVELFHITPLDITSKEDVNEIIKSINTATLAGSQHKLILIDDIDEYHSYYKSRLLEIGEISNHPVIFTCKKYNFPSEFIKNVLNIRLKKPLTYELLNYLKTLSKLDIYTLDNIAKHSHSVRSAVLSLYSYSPNTLVHPIETSKMLYNSIRKRSLTQPLTRYNINFIFDSIQGYNEDVLKVMEKFAEFNYRIKVKYEDIEPFFVNNMAEPIEHINLSFRKVYFKKKEKKIVKPKPKLSGPSLDRYF